MAASAASAERSKAEASQRSGGDTMQQCRDDMPGVSTALSSERAHRQMSRLMLLRRKRSMVRPVVPTRAWTPSRIDRSCPWTSMPPMAVSTLSLRATGSQSTHTRGLSRWVYTQPLLPLSAHSQASIHTETEPATELRVRLTWGTLPPRAPCT